MGKEIGTFIRKQHQRLVQNLDNMRKDNSKKESKYKVVKIREEEIGLLKWYCRDFKSPIYSEVNLIRY